MCGILAREHLLAEGSMSMTNLSSLRLERSRLLRLSLLIIFCLAIFSGGSSAAVARNRCRDRCDEAYRFRKDACRSIPLKHERKRCEEAAKRAKDNCKHRCR